MFDNENISGELLDALETIRKECEAHEGADACRNECPLFNKKRSECGLFVTVCPALWKTE